jgi:hypothetical protein
VAAVGVAVVLPDTKPGLNLCLGVPLWIGTYLAAKHWQGRMFQAHQEQGGAQASGWAVVGFSLLGAALTLGAAFGAAALYEEGFGDQRLAVNAKEEVYYSRDVTEAEARTLARVFQEQRVFDGASEKNVRLRKDGPDYVVSVFLIFGFDDPQAHEEYRALGREVSRAFGGQPVRVELCDREGTPRKELPPERRR